MEALDLDVGAELACRAMVSSYKGAGVDIDAGNELVRRIRGLARGTQGPEVLGGVGGFASLFRLPEGGEQPLLVSSCDGVGTKLKIAFATGRHDTVGIDLVAMNVNDVICCGARPLFFLDYLAVGTLELGVAEAVIRGVAEGCKLAGCALVGGETAEMPGFYAPGEYDLAGFAVGLVNKDSVIDGSALEAGDVVLGIPSSGLHSNGFSLARKVLLQDGANLERNVPTLGTSLGEALLTPTRIYTSLVGNLRQTVDVKAIVHVTGGGLIDNPPRVLPQNLAWRLDPARWEVPPIMRLIQQASGTALHEMRRTFNMGLGLLVAVGAQQASEALKIVESAQGRVVGEIVARSGTPVEFVGE